MTRSASSRTTAGLIALLCAIWGSTWIVIKAGLATLPPLTSAGVRFAIAAIVFAAITPALHAREGGDRPPLWLSAQMALLTFAVPYGIVYLGETVIPSGLAAVLWGVFPLLIAAASHAWLPSERIAGGQWLGFAVGFAGLVLLFLTDLRQIGPEAVAMGALFLLSPGSAAVSQTLIKRNGSGTSSVLLNRNGLALSAVMLIAAAFVTERQASSVWNATAVASVIHLAVVGTVVPFGIYFWLLRRVDSYRMSLICYVTPAIAIFLGWAIGREAVGWHTLAGTGLILGGVALVLRNPSQR